MSKNNTDSSEDKSTEASKIKNEYILRANKTH